MSDVPALLETGPASARRVLALAHGAGASMDSEFMNVVADGLAERGIRVVRFEFPYMARRRTSGKRGPPDREPVLREAWLQVIEALREPKLLIGGKSLGGRIASLLADEADVAGLVCLGYPFHPPRKPEQLRVAHLANLRTPALIVQGERDPFGRREEVATYDLAPRIAVHFLTDGDHSFEPRKSSGTSWQDNMREAVDTVARFVEKCS